ncbi:MAG: hypothetical protein KJZ93_22165 [Caldilineaceae bacterium]|nr:hypothetical protein [Caldilineaceae bacterium]
MTTALTPVDESTLPHALTALAAMDADLAGILALHGPPPLWAREPGFPTLIHIILEQQVSLASARAAFDRLLAVAAPLTPERFLVVDDATLRTIGFSRQKSGYARHLARVILEGKLDVDNMINQDDRIVRTSLLALKGIGPWTADIYLLMALRRPDIWPTGDLALQVAMQRVKRLPQRPTSTQMEELAEPWRPWRAVAARLLWHHYLSARANKK